MLYTAEAYSRQTNTAPKARTLCALKARGLPVPDFRILVGDSLLPDEQALLLNEFPDTQFAVRFAAKNEDTANTTQAGRFTTELAVAGDNLIPAVQRVIETSKPLLSVNEYYCVIIQVFIPADKSGVIFSRHPELLFPALVEESFGAGSVVDGQVSKQYLITPSTKLNYDNYIQELYTIACALETTFAVPQDIEWCVKNETLWILQSRPVTTLSGAQRNAIKHISPQLPPTRPYTFESSSSVETFRTVTPFEYDFVQSLYATDGAAAIAYEQLGFDYVPQNQFVCFGNRLYVDVEREQQALFPAYRYNHPEQKYKIAWWPISDVLVTAKNIARQNKPLPPEGIKQALATILEHLQQPVELPASPTAAIAAIQALYAPVFIINIFVKRAECAAYLTHQEPELIELISLYQSGVPDLKDGTTIGNSLALLDDSLFLYPPTKQAATTMTTDRLRELCRWQAVRLRNALQTTLAEAGSKQGLSWRDMCFHTFAEIAINQFDGEARAMRQRHYTEQLKWRLPARISSVAQAQSSDTVTLSPGEATGVLVESHQLVNITRDQAVILYVENLSADTVTYFRQVAGVICHNGGVLSHAAIVAREQGLPVVRSNKFADTLINQRVTIDTSQDLALRLLN